MIGLFVSTLFNAARQIGPVFLTKQLHMGTQGYVVNGLCSTIKTHMAGGNWSFVPVRTKIRWHFPRSRERKRVKLLGWATRLSTLSGRKILMRRILKGRHVLSH